MSKIRLNPYLNFPGTCREAFAFYADCLGADIVFQLTMGESPMADEVPKNPITISVMFVCRVMGLC